MQLDYTVASVATRHPFIIARGGQSDWPVVWVRLQDDDGAEGWGEAAPSRFYGETAETVAAALDRFAPLLAHADAWSIEATEAALHRELRGNAAARLAVSAALHDLAARRVGLPLWKWWGLDPAAAPRSSFTIAIAPDDDTLRARVREARDYPLLKIKLGTPRDREILRIVREEAPAAELRVDANCGWTPKGTLAMLPVLEEVGVTLLEQPLPPHDLDGLRLVRQHATMPLVADESCIGATDVARLAGVVDGVNLKLMKCGSLREAHRIIAAARAHGMFVMAGCMIESTLGIAGAAHLAPLLDGVDLDGAALLADDPWDGPGLRDANAPGRVVLGDAPGLGVTRRG
jgi:L-alanine-DL-glutamate epimerase-like enolase superfamily enzyme